MIFKSYTEEKRKQLMDLCLALFKLKIEFRYLNQIRLLLLDVDKKSEGSILVSTFRQILKSVFKGINS